MPLTDTVRLAAIVYQSGFAIDEFVARFAGRLRADGVMLAGAVQMNTPGSGGGCSNMALVDLASQHRFGISQDLGVHSAGCRLDTRGIAEATVRLDGGFARNSELLLVNKFGRAEAEGGGLRSLIARAVDDGIPALTAVRPPYSDAWKAFHGGIAADLAPDFAAVMDWCHEAVGALRVRRARAAGSELRSPA